MVARAVDVVIYQRLFDEEGARRVAEVLEVERPGVRIGPSGDVAYRLRRLVVWDEDVRNWVFPAAPSERLRRALELMGLEWPADPVSADLDEETEPYAANG
jgi:hypothetical protein